MSTRFEMSTRPHGKDFQLRPGPCAVILALALCLLSPYLAVAQTPPETSGRQISADTTRGNAVSSVVRTEAIDSTALRRFPSPGGAFLRSVLVPGWGQAAYGAYFRGGVYFAAESGSWFMLLKTMAKLGEARDIEKWRMGAVRDSLMAAIAADEELAEQYRQRAEGLEMAVDLEVDQHPDVLGSRKLVNARKEQREDWIVLTLFWMLASGVDAFVTAHLSDFPARVNAEPRPDGRLDVGVSLPVGGR
jgi:hypothetical protein